MNTPTPSRPLVKGAIVAKAVTRLLEETTQKQLIQVLLLFLSVFFFFSSLSGLGSIIARYSKLVGMTREQAGLMFATASLISAMLRIPVGFLADRYGSKKFMAIGLASASLAGVVALNAYNFLTILIARGVQGIAIAFFIAPSIAAASLLASQATITAYAVSARSTAISLALIVSPIIASTIVDIQGYKQAFIYVILVGLAGLIPLSLLKVVKVNQKNHESRKESQQSLIARELRKRIVIGIILIALLDGSIFISLQVVPQYEIAEKNLPATYYGLFASLSGVSGLVTRSISAKLLKKAAPKTLVTGLAVETIGLSTLAMLRDNPAYFYIAAIMLGGGLGLVVTSEQYTLMTTTSPAIRNSIASIYAIGVDLGGGLGSIIYMKIASLYSYTTSYLAMLAVEATALTIALTLLKSRTIPRLN